MKKIISLLLAIIITASTSSIAFATNYDDYGEETFDLTTITEPVQVIFEDREVLPDGTVITTTTTATKPRMSRLDTEYSTVVSTRSISFGGNTEKIITLTTDFWYNRYDKTVGWSGATVDLWSSTDSDLSATEPEGVSGDPLIGDPWVKVSTDWSYSRGNTVNSGTVWSKITCEGKISRS